jgi:hypothetical protein
MASGGAKLDEGAKKDYEYSEAEAWEAFHRAAKGHQCKYSYVMYVQFIFF